MLFRSASANFPATWKQGAPPKYTVVGYYEDNGNDEKCAENIKDALNKNPDLACFVGMNAKHGPVLLRVLKDLGKLDKIKLITFDTPDETLDGIEQGHIYATLAQDPFRFGYKAIGRLSTLVNGDPLEVPIVGRGSDYLGVEAIRRDNVAQFRDALQKQQQAAEQQATMRRPEEAGVNAARNLTRPGEHRFAVLGRPATRRLLRTRNPA